MWENYLGELRRQAEEKVLELEEKSQYEGNMNSHVKTVLSSQCFLILQIGFVYRVYTAFVKKSSLTILIISTIFPD